MPALRGKPPTITATSTPLQASAGSVLVTMPAQKGGPGVLGALVGGAGGAGRWGPRARGWGRRLLLRARAAARRGALEGRLFARRRV
jgi:hypothetical protein